MNDNDIKQALKKTETLLKETDDLENTVRQVAVEVKKLKGYDKTLKGIFDNNLNNFLTEAQLKEYEQGQTVLRLELNEKNEAILHNYLNNKYETIINKKLKDGFNIPIENKFLYNAFFDDVFTCFSHFNNLDFNKNGALCTKYYEQANKTLTFLDTIYKKLREINETSNQINERTLAITKQFTIDEQRLKELEKPTLVYLANLMQNVTDILKRDNKVLDRANKQHEIINTLFLAPNIDYEVQPGYVILTLKNEQAEIKTDTNQEIPNYKAIERPQTYKKALDTVNNGVFDNSNNLEIDEKGRLFIDFDDVYDKQDHVNRDITVTFDYSKLDIDQLAQQYNLSSQTILDNTDLDIMEICYSLYADDEPTLTVKHTSLTEIAILMTGKQNPNTKDINTVRTRLKKLRGGQFTIKPKDDSKSYYEGSFLPNETGKGKINGQYTDEMVNIFRKPPLMTFSNTITNQITSFSYETKYIKGVKMTDRNKKIRDYLLQRIAHTKRDQKKGTDTTTNTYTFKNVNYDTIFKKFNIDRPRDQRATIENIDKMLNKFITTKDIVSFKHKKDETGIVFEVKAKEVKEEKKKG